MTLRLDRNEFQRQFGERVRTFRTNRDLSQVVLGAKAGYTFQTISNIERGLVWPSLMTVFVLAEVFDVHPKALLFGEE